MTASICSGLEPRFHRAPPGERSIVVPRPLGQARPEKEDAHSKEKNAR